MSKDSFLDNMDTIRDNMDTMFDGARDRLVKVLREFSEDMREAEVALALQKAKESDERRLLMSKINKLPIEVLRSIIVK